MIIFFIALAIGACVASAGTGVFVPSIINAILAFWANGVLANYRRDARSAPNYASFLSMLTILGSLALGTAGLVLR